MTFIACKDNSGDIVLQCIAHYWVIEWSTNAPLDDARTNLYEFYLIGCIVGVIVLSDIVNDIDEYCFKSYVKYDFDKNHLKLKKDIFWSNHFKEMKKKTIHTAPSSSKLNHYEQTTETILIIVK